VGKPLQFFQTKLSELEDQQTSMRKTLSLNDKCLEASFKISYRIAKSGFPHNLGENIILPSIIDTVGIICGSKYEHLLQSIPLSDNTVKRRIDMMAEDIEKRLIQRVKNSNMYSLQLDETTDIKNLSQLLVYVRYIHEGVVEEEMLFCRPLSTTTKAEDIFFVLNTYMENNSIRWDNCISVCTDGARNMTGKKSGLAAKILSINSRIMWNHCIIHREALVAKKLPADLKDVLDFSVKVINFIKSRAMNSRIFAALCEEMGSDHKTLLLHTEVRWLSRGKALFRLFSLLDEVTLFLQQHNFPSYDLVSNKHWQYKLAYLSDIFSKLNELNLSLQGKTINILSANSKIKSFKKKILLWISCLESRNVVHFSSLHDLHIQDEAGISEDTLSLFITHLQGLVQQLDNYFPQQEELPWIVNPFINFLENVKYIPPSLQEKFSELTEDSSLSIEFKTTDLTSFWIKARQEFPVIADMALKVLLPFASTYLCETSFSSLVYLKNKYRSRMNVEPDLRIKLSKIEPEITTLMRKVHAHPSH